MSKLPTSKQIAARLRARASWSIARAYGALCAIPRDSIRAEDYNDFVEALRCLRTIEIRRKTRRFVKALRVYKQVEKTDAND